MKQKVSPAVIVVALVIVLAVAGFAGLRYMNSKGPVPTADKPAAATGMDLQQRYSQQRQQMGARPGGPAGAPYGGGGSPYGGAPGGAPYGGGGSPYGGAPGGAPYGGGGSPYGGAPGGGSPYGGGGSPYGSGGQ